MNWYCTDLDDGGYFKLHVETKNSSMWKRIKMTPQFWFVVSSMKAELFRPCRGVRMILEVVV